MKTISITDAQIEIIKKALYFAYNSTLKSIDSNRDLLPLSTIDEIIKEANKFIDVQDIFNKSTTI
jgi:hypothetical protein